MYVLYVYPVCTKNLDGFTILTVAIFLQRLHPLFKTTPCFLWRRHQMTTGMNTHRRMFAHCFHQFHGHARWYYGVRCTVTVPCWDGRVLKTSHDCISHLGHPWQKTSNKTGMAKPLGVSSFLFRHDQRNHACTLWKTKDGIVGPVLLQC